MEKWYQRRKEQQKDNMVGIGRTDTLMKQRQQQQMFPCPSLVRRARGIRRRTTNVYCETLKRLKDEDAALISQILLISLKSRSEATDYECSCAGTSTTSTIPSVDFTYPPTVSNARQLPPTLFYPDFMKGSIQRREDREAFQVVLTNEKGQRTFAFCFKFLNSTPSNNFLIAQNTDNKSGSFISDDSGIGTLPLATYSVLVFVSSYPHETLFHELASNFVNLFQRDRSNLSSICHDMLQLKFSTLESTIRPLKYVVNCNKYPNHWSRSNVSKVIEKVGVENAVFVFLSLLSERRVIITGSSVTDVSMTVQAFVHLLAPLEWPHTLIPIIPDSQTELCFNPTPYICGILRYNLNRISELLCPEKYAMGEMLNEDITIMDVDRGMVVPPISRPDRRIGLKTMLQHITAMGFPQSAVCEIMSFFKGCLPVRNPEHTNYKLEKKVMIWYAKLFGHYRKFGSILTARNRKLFAHAHPCAETRLFLKWFAENGILQSFIFAQSERTSSVNNNCSLLHRFHKILKKYAPPVDCDGKRRRTKSILWKVFTL